MTDVIVIGAGHNGLTCAAYLAKAGHKVLCLEASADSGGMSATHGFAEGFSMPGLSHLSYPVSDAICSDLKLHKHGYRPGPAIDTIVLDAGSDPLVVGRNSVSSDNITQKDQESYAKFTKQYYAYAKALKPFFDHKPPRLKDMDRADMLTLGKLGWNLRLGLGKEPMYEFLRVAAMNIYDLLDETFDDERLKSCLAVDATLGSAMGPRTPGTVLTWLHRLHGSMNGAMALNCGGHTGLIDALLESASAHGVEIRNSAKVAKILIENGRANGVLLEDGTKIEAQQVVSSADPRSTFLSLVGAPQLDAMFANRVAQIRGKGVVAKLNLALDQLPKIANVEKSSMGNRFLVSPSMDYLERAFNHSKYGEYSEKPALEFSFPSLHNEDLAPAGHHVLSVNIAYAPHELKDGWEHNKKTFSEQIISQLATLMPNLEASIVASELLTPADIEKRYLTTQGHWHHGELSLHQSLMLRPVHGSAQYNTPIDDLFLCGAGCHPGGDLTGLPGRNAAKRIIELGGGK